MVIMDEEKAKKEISEMISIFKDEKTIDIDVEGTSLTALTLEEEKEEEEKMVKKSPTYFEKDADYLLKKKQVRKSQYV